MRSGRQQPLGAGQAGIRFFYREVLGQQDFSLRVPAKRSGRLPEPLSRGEIARILEATQNTKHRVLLMTAYGGGLRVSGSTPPARTDLVRATAGSPGTRLACFTLRAALSGL